MKLTLELKNWGLTDKQLNDIRKINNQSVNIRYNGGLVSKMYFKIKRNEIISSLKEQLISVNGKPIVAEIYY